MRIVWAVAAAMGLFAGAAEAQPAPREPLSAERMWALKRLGDPVLTPDGRAAILSVSTWDVAKSKRSADLWLYPVDGGAPRQLTADPANEEEPQVSPDGRWLAFVARRDGEEADALYVLPLNAPGEAQKLAAVATGVGDIRWLPDSGGVAFVTRVWPELKTWAEQAARAKARAESKMTAKVYDKAPVLYWDTFLDDRQAHLYVADLTRAEIRPVTLNSGRALARRKPGPFPYDLSPDGREVAFQSDVDTTGTRPNLDVFVMPLAGGAPVNLTAANLAPDVEPKYSPDGRHLAWLQQRVRGHYGDRWRLMLRDRAGQVRSLNDDFDRSAESLAWSPDSKGLYGSIDDAGTRRIYRFDVAGGAPRRLTESQDFLAPAARGGTLVALRQSFAAPSTLVRVDPRSGAVTQLSRENDAALAAVALGRTESVTYKGADGRDIQMWVTYPPGFDRSKRYPLFLLIHGGPHSGITDSWTWRWNAQVFAGWGYVVAWPNFHGSSGFGDAFTDSINPDWMEKPYADVIAAGNWFAAQRYIDRERMVAGGGSYGGYLTTVLLGREHPFKALVAHAAVYNMYAQLAGDWGGEQPRFGEYWERKEEFERISPHVYAANFKTPTLVIHGQQDQRVPVAHGLELFQTLQRRGVPSRFIYYPDENHWILTPQNSIFWYAEVRRWLEQHAAPGGR